MLSCSWKETCGVDCPTCGAQRSFELLINGELWQSIVLFPALIPLLITILFTILHLKFKFKAGAKWIVVLFSITVAIIVINYIIKLSSMS